MKRKLSIITKIVAFISLIWLIFAFFVHYIFWIPPLVIVFVLTSFFMIHRIIMALRSRDFALLIEPIILVAILAGINFSPVRFTGVYLRLFIEKGAYTRTIENIKAGREPSERKYILDTQAPLRVAFPWYGAADNWFGICYDPTGLVMNANILKRDYSNVNEPEYRKAGGLYGGGLRDATHIWDDWYFCNFT